MTGGRLLIVDDEVSILLLMRRLFGGKYTLVLERDGSAALKLLQVDWDFDAVICDILLPYVNGMEIYAEVKKVNPHLADRIVFLTGGSLIPSINHFMKAVSNHVLEKPFNLKQLEELVDSIVRSRSDEV